MATGNFRIAAGVTKAIAMGASAVAMATASMVAIGCQQYFACHTGNCPVGIATQRPELEARLDADLSTERGAATFRAFREELELLCRAIGVEDIHDLTTDYLVTLDSEIAAHTSIKHAWAAGYPGSRGSAGFIGSGGRMRIRISGTGSISGMSGSSAIVAVRRPYQRAAGSAVRPCA